MIGSDGSWGIIKTRDGQDSWLAHQQLQPSAVKPGNDTNHIRADCNGNQLTLYANGQQLVQVEDGEFNSGQVGLITLTYTAGLDVTFDNFEVPQAP